MISDRKRIAHCETVVGVGYPDRGLSDGSVGEVGDACGDAAWSVRDLVNHLITGNHLFKRVLLGDPPSTAPNGTELSPAEWAPAYPGVRSYAARSVRITWRN